MVEATLHDGSAIAVEVVGDGPAILLPVNPVPVTGPKADELRAWGMDPALGRSLIDGLRDRWRVVAFDYEGHVLAKPKPATLTPDNLAADLLAIALAAGVGRFAYYGYSWLGMAGLQLAIRTDRLNGLAVGGYPPLCGPYEEMLAVTNASHEFAVSQAAAGPASTSTVGTEAPEPGDWSSVSVTLSEAQTRQFLTLYSALQGFDDAAIQDRLVIPRLAFAGAADDIEYEPRWGGVRVSMGPTLVRERARLEALGWRVEVLPGLDHMQAMQASSVLPILAPWLESADARQGAHVASD